MMDIPSGRSAAKEYRAERSNAAGDNDPLLAIARFTDGALTESDRTLLQKGFDAYLNAGGTIPLERCLGIPSTHTGWRKLRRDMWLRKAALLIDADGSTTGSQNLKNEWDRFISRGPWNAWRDDDAPPLEATALSEALFWATRYNRSDSLTSRRIEQIVGNIFRQKFR